MSLQFDLEPGFDLSSVSSATQEQVMQALSQMAPLSNIGGIYYGTTAPDTVNNPRFKRYIWVDSTDLDNIVLRKYDNGDWNLNSLAAGSVLATMLADLAVTVFQSDNATAKIALREDQAADLTKRNFVLRIDPSGIFVEPVSLDTFLQAAGPIGLNRLSLVGSAENYLLAVQGGTLQYIAFDPDIIAANTVSPAVLANSTAYYVLAANASGVMTAQLFDPANMISGTDANRVPLNKLQGALSGASVNDVMAFDGTNWVKKTPALITSATVVAASALTAIAAATAIDLTHNLGAIPRYTQIVLRNTSGGASNGFPSLAELPIHTCDDGVLGGAPVFSHYNSSINNTKLIIRAATNYTTIAFDGSGSVNLTAANWTPVGYFAI